MMAVKKTVRRKKAVVSTPDSNPKGGTKSKAATAKRKASRKSGVEEFSSISIHERVALLAYSYWEERGMQGGSPEEDWYRAEKELLARVSQRNS